jgi:cytoskeletal protein CcmA (bactofilin family)
MKNLILALIIWMPLQIMAQERETRNIDSFTEVSSSASIKVTLVKGSSPKVDVQTDGDLEDVLTDVSGGKLKISRAPQEGMFNFSSNNDKVEVIVYYQEIEALKVSSSSYMEVKGTLNSNKLTLDVSSSGKLKVSANAKAGYVEVSSSGKIDAHLNTDQLTAKVSSSGKLNLTGSSDDFEGKVSSSGNVVAEDFSCFNAKISASSSGKIQLGVKNELVARASSSGKINYSGSPKVVDINTSSGGKVNSVR